MTSTDRVRGVLGAGTLVLALALGGCGMPGEPQAPSLELPVPVSDLGGARTGDVVTLAWTMPKYDTSKVALKPNEAVAVRVCRAEGPGACVTAGELNVLPGAKGSFTETLAGPLAGGAPRALSYFVELKNRRRRSAGMSNAVTVGAGLAPAAVEWRCIGRRRLARAR